MRRISYGIGVERTFPLHSPRMKNPGAPRRQGKKGKLFYLRGLSGKSARIPEKKMMETIKDIVEVIVVAFVIALVVRA